MNEFHCEKEPKVFNGDIKDRQGEDGSDESNIFDTQQVNLSLSLVTHFGFHDHPSTKPIRKATHNGPKSPTISVHTPNIEEGFSKTSYKASIKAITAHKLKKPKWAINKTSKFAIFFFWYQKFQPLNQIIKEIDNSRDRKQRVSRETEKYQGPERNIK